MSVCDGCSFAIIKLRPQDKEPMLASRDVNVTLPQFGTATVRDCWICTKFSRWLETEHPDLFDIWHKEQFQVTYSMTGFAHISEPQHRPLCLVMMSITAQGHDRDDDACGVDVNIVPAEESITPSFTLPKRLLDLTMPTTWIERCKQNHTRCGEDSKPWYPTRLLHFGPLDRKVRLVISKDHCPKGPYVTLSHRWGPHMKLKLNSATMTRLQRGARLSSLSQVFQDSVKIAQRLKIYYLWIDALCIKQDEQDSSDWKVESQSMDKVYSSAFLNISATLSSEGTESLFDRDIGPTLPSKIKLNIGGITQDYLVIDGNIWYDQIDNAPLNNRGWVFQERFSARRVLHFGREQVAWECRELEASETFPDGFPKASNASFISKPGIYTEFMSLSHSSNETLDDKLASEWHIIVENYSKCGLTLPRDKLIAFEGVAKAVMASRGGRCVAGIWQNNIAYDLAWYRFSKEKESFPISQTYFRAPSWSWACVDGLVNYPAFVGEVQRHFINGGEILEPNANGNNVLSEHPSIRVQGVCLPMVINWSQGNMVSFEITGFRFSLGDPFGAQISLDGPEEEVQKLAHQSRILLLPLLATSRDIYGLVLAKVRGVRVHRRVGAIEIPTVESFNSDQSPHGDQIEKGKTENPIRLKESATTGQDLFDSVVWNMAALRLVYKIDTLKRSEIFIC